MVTLNFIRLEIWLNAWGSPSTSRVLCDWLSVSDLMFSVCRAYSIPLAIDSFHSDSLLDMRVVETHRSSVIQSRIKSSTLISLYDNILNKLITAIGDASSKTFVRISLKDFRLPRCLLWVSKSFKSLSQSATLNKKDLKFPKSGKDTSLNM